MSPHGQPQAQLLAPGHPLLDATVDLVLERYRPLLKQGAILVADADESEEPRALVYVEHAIQNARELARRAAPGRLQAAAVRRADRGLGAAHRRLRALPRLPADRARRARARPAR